MPEPHIDSPRLVRDRHSALAIAALVCLVLPALTILVLGPDDAARPARALGFAASGLVALGLLVVCYTWSPYRALGIPPFVAVAWVAATAHGAYWHEWPGWVHGTALGLILGALVRGHRGKLPVALTVGVGVVALGGGWAWGSIARERPLEEAEWGVLGVSVVLLATAWLRLFRPAFELTVEPLLWRMYRIRWTGPGLVGFPRTGPCLIIANHACWYDPIFLSKVFPRPLTPMMTSRFYDLPVMARLMKAFGIIRVPEKTFKKDAPEVGEAVAALNRGECVVIFPEGYLRRTADKPLRRFGQGVWQLLKARPNTPVFATWIEGGWGSFTSYFNGPPRKNKTKDVRRPIGVGVSVATTVPPEVLEEHLRTRIYLMNLVSAARAHLGLDPLPPFALPEKAEDGEE